MLRKRILVAEDDPSVQKVMKFRLEHEGFTVLVCADGEEALQEAQRDPRIDLVLMDVKLPGMDGYEVCRRLRGKPSTARIPILIMSGTESQMVQLADRCVEVGADDWIKKPFQTRELMAKVSRLIEERGRQAHGG